MLDEIVELPLDAQVRLLQVLQDGFVERVGGTNPVHVDVRIVAATHRDLAQMVRENRFREDLWYRLAVFPMLMTPLRDRSSDIPEFAQHFAERAAVHFGLAPTYPTDSDLQLLQAYDWPGNIREFSAVIDRAVILGNGRSLEIVKSLGFEDSRDTEQQASAANAVSSVSGAVPSGSAFLTLDQAMAAHIKDVLRATGGRIEGSGGAARILGINPHTLRARMRKLGIAWSTFRSAQ